MNLKKMLAPLVAPICCNLCEQEDCPGRGGCESYTSYMEDPRDWKVRYLEFKLEANDEKI